MAINTAAMMIWVTTAPIAVSIRSAPMSAGFSFFSTIDDCWKNTIHGMITAPMLAEAR